MILTMFCHEQVPYWPDCFEIDRDFKLFIVVIEPKDILKKMHFNAC